MPHVVRIAIIVLVALSTGCPKPVLDPSGSASGFTDGERPRQPPELPPETPRDLPPATLECPGETQCPCAAGCPGTLTCGPTNACTRLCRDDADCTSGVSGESCIAGLCGVPCDPSVDTGGCEPAGMRGAACVSLGADEHYCGYLP